jgi:quercetin dioxygenase-like cupin family protein
MGRKTRRLGLVACVAALWITSAWWVGRAEPLANQQPPVDEAANFTGRSFRMEPKGLAVARRGFEAAARSNWHVHNGPQLLLVEQGRMRVQVQGQPMKELALHESVYLPGGVGTGMVRRPDRRPLRFRSSSSRETSGWKR